MKKLPLRRVNVNKGKVASEQAMAMMAMKMTAKPWLKNRVFFPIDIHKASKKVRYFDGWEFKHPQMVLVSD